MKGEVFELTEEHLKLLRRGCIEFNDGVPGLDMKRPFGNSDYYKDIFKILKWGYRERDGEYPEEAYERADRILTELLHALQIVILNAGKAVKLGRYQQKDEYDYSSWRFVK